MPMEPEASGRLVISYVSGCRGQIDTDAKISLRCGDWPGVSLRFYISRRRIKIMRYEDLVYHKGDIYIAELGENFGHEQSGTRPVIIMQNDVGNYFSPTVTIVPLTSKDKKPGQPTHYRLDMKKYPFLTSSSTALCESPRTLDKELIKRIWLRWMKLWRRILATGFRMLWMRPEPLAYFPEINNSYEIRE